MFCTRLANGGLFPTGDPIVPFVISPRFECLNKRTHIHTVHMALVGYFIVFSFVTKPGQTLEFLLWGTIVPLNFLVGYHCSIVASTPQPMAYASTHIYIYIYIHTLLKTIKGTCRSAPSLVCGHSQVQLLEDMHNCTSLKSVMFKKQLTLLAMSLTQPWHLFKG